MAPTKSNSVPVNLRMDVDTANKLKYIAWHDRETFTDVMHAAAERQIKEFEKKHG